LREILEIIEKLNVELVDTVIFVKINVNKSHQIPKNYDITSLPTTILLKEGKEIVRIVGSRNYESTKNTIVNQLK